MYKYYEKLNKVNIAYVENNRLSNISSYYLYYLYISINN